MALWRNLFAAKQGVACTARRGFVTLDRADNVLRVCTGTGVHGMRSMNCAAPTRPAHMVTPSCWLVPP